jgi:predicted metal-binding protein
MSTPTPRTLDIAQTNALIELAISLGADHAATMATQDIPIHPELRVYCAQNSCGRYATCWVGPPAVGEVEELAKQLRSFPVGLVVQTVFQLEDSFDFPGMEQAKDEHMVVFQRILDTVRQQYAEYELLALDCGCCNICPECTYPDEPCRHPDQAIPSVEVYGVHVSDMLTKCGLKYNNGKDTVSYVGLIAFR